MKSTLQIDYGPIAQLGARLNGIEKAGGSNPPGSTEANAGVVGHPSASREKRGESPAGVAEHLGRTRLNPEWIALPVRR